MKNKKIIIPAVVIILVALFLEVMILNFTNDSNSYRTSKVLADRVIAVLNKNDTRRNELTELLKVEYIVRAKAVAYILDAKPQVEADVEELRHIAGLLSIDEIHIFDQNGYIYSGTLPKYFGYNFDSGGQMSYFKPMLTDKELTLCQEITPNVAEKKMMMYAITWNDDKTKMVQVGIEPGRLLREIRQTHIFNVVAAMPMYEGMEIYVADAKKQVISGTTDRGNIRKTLDEIGIPLSHTDKKEEFLRTVRINGKPCRCTIRRDSKYIVAVAEEKALHLQESISAILIVAVYLILASLCMIYMLSKVINEKFEKERLLYISNTDEITGCFNRHAYEVDISQFDFEKDWIYISMDLNGLKRANDSYGHAAGDELICGIADCLKDIFSESGKVYRIGGDEFVVILTEQLQQFEDLMKAFDSNVKSWRGTLIDSMTISYGCVFSTERSWNSIDEISKVADQRMYECKKRHYSKN